MGIESFKSETSPSGGSPLNVLFSTARWRFVAIVATVVGVAGLGAYAVAAKVADHSAPPGIAPGVQEKLHETTTTDSSPTEWGEFLIVPVTAPSQAIDNEPSPAPDFGETANVTGQLEGPDAPVRARQLVASFRDLPPGAQALVTARGLRAVGAEAKENLDGSFLSYVLYGTTDPKPAMMQLSAFTPTRPVRVSEFPDTAIYDFRTSTAVSGHPTITRFPDKGTSDPNGDREIK